MEVVTSPGVILPVLQVSPIAQQKGRTVSLENMETHQGFEDIMVFSCTDGPAHYP